MNKHVCKQCEISFEYRNIKRIYCSNKCYHQSRIGQKQSIACVEKRRKSMLGKTYDEQRKRILAYQDKLFYLKKNKKK